MINFSAHLKNVLQSYAPSRLSAQARTSCYRREIDSDDCTESGSAFELTLSQIVHSYNSKSHDVIEHSILDPREGTVYLKETLIHYRIGTSRAEFIASRDNHICETKVFSTDPSIHLRTAGNHNSLLWSENGTYNSELTTSGLAAFILAWLIQMRRVSVR